jgi:hypothetical protein
MRATFLWAIAMQTAVGHAFGQPSAAAPATAGERWRVTSLYEYVGVRDSAPSKRERRQDDVCLAPGQATFDKDIAAEIPAQLKGKCWINDQREDARRKQVKYLCKDGSSVEGVTRRDSPAQWGTQIVINIAGQGGMSITREMTRLAGRCDPDAKPLPRPPAPIAPEPAAKE